MSGRSITADGKLSPNISIYNSVLLDSTGIIHQVKTTFPAGETSFPSEWANTGVYTTAYSFSPFPADLFMNALSPHRFEEDNREPHNAIHLKLQEIILTGSDFVNKFRATLLNHYVELVFRFPISAAYFDENILEILRLFFQYSNDHCEGQDWKIFASRRIESGDDLFIAVSLER